MALFCSFIRTLWCGVFFYYLEGQLFTITYRNREEYEPTGVFLRERERERDYKKTEEVRKSAPDILFCCKSVLTSCAFLSADKHKMERFLRQDAPTVVTVYAPITFPPAGTLIFKQRDDGKMTYSYYTSYRHGHLSRGWL